MNSSNISTTMDINFVNSNNTLANPTYYFTISTLLYDMECQDNMKRARKYLGRNYRLQVYLEFYMFGIYVVKCVGLISNFTSIRNDVVHHLNNSSSC
jgi:hypothetical protein